MKQPRISGIAKATASSLADSIPMLQPATASLPGSQSSLGTLRGIRTFSSYERIRHSPPWGIRS